MSKMGFSFVLGSLFALALPTPAGPVRPILTQVSVVAPYASNTFVVEFRARERANVIIMGDASTYLGLYVFDEDGNCIQKDDEGRPSNKDDCAVIWYPPRTQNYLIEVRNLGGAANQYQIAIR